MISVDNEVYVFVVLQFFDMPKYDEVKALNIYKKAGQQVHNHSFLNLMELQHNLNLPFFFHDS